MNFLLLFGFIWFVMLSIFSTWSDNKSSRRGIEKLKNVKEEKLEAKDPKKIIENVPVFDDFEDNFAELPKNTKKRLNKRKHLTTRSSEELLDPPETPERIKEYRRRLNLTNPGLFL